MWLKKYVAFENEKKKGIKKRISQKVSHLNLGDYSSPERFEKGH